MMSRALTPAGTKKDRFVFEGEGRTPNLNSDGCGRVAAFSHVATEWCATPLVMQIVALDTVQDNCYDRRERNISRPVMPAAPLT